MQVVQRVLEVFELVLGQLLILFCLEQHALNALQLL